MKIQIKVIKP